MQTLMAKIVEWGKELPYWEQVTLDKIINGEEITEEIYDQILQFLLEDEGLAKKNKGREIPRFYQQVTSLPTSANPKRLLKISNLSNINALAGNQTLAFNSALTAIYGENGSGKSGYARVLGCAGFTRGDREVLPDITKPKSSEESLTAEIHYLENGLPRQIHYQVGNLCRELSSFYVFDSTSVHVHMSEKNEFSFSPAGLIYLKQLAEETDAVRSRLARKVDECCKQSEFSVFFQGDTEVSRLINNLGPDTDLNKLKALANISSEEKKRRSELAIEIANVELEKVKTQITSIKQQIDALETFSTQLGQAQDQLSDVHVNEIRKSMQHYIRCQEVTSQAGVDQFNDTNFKNIGSPAWQRFIEASRNWAYEGLPNGEEYPNENDVCLLCRQPLTEEGRRLIVRLLEFLKGEAKAALTESARLLSLEQQVVNNICLFNIGSDHSQVFQIIGENDPNLLEGVITCVQMYRNRYNLLKQAFEKHQLVEFELLSLGYTNELKALIKKMQFDLKKLEDMNLEETVRQLEKEKLELDHRIFLEPVYGKIEEYVNKRKWAQAAKTVGSNTRHITVKHNELFKELVTDEYIRLFEETLKAMGRQLKVKITMPGQKGKTLKQLVLEAASDAKDIRPEKVLSEGEKRAVALADFLTEVALDSSSDGIILDDPVTSLDLELRETIAKMLVEKANDRQVVIFTHDLPFLYYLKSNAEKYSIPISTHWIRRGNHDGRPGYVFLDNSPALERDYKKTTKARDVLIRAKVADAELQESLLREGFGALRTNYEAFIVFEMFNEVVMRFDERISFGRLKDICWDTSIAADVIESCERLSKFIEGHLHSDTFMGFKPTPDTLQKEIEHFECIQKSLKQLKKG
jgi:recombinational DNA repair ATPase RecF